MKTKNLFYQGIVVAAVAALPVGAFAEGTGRAEGAERSEVNTPDKAENYTFGRENREIDTRDGLPQAPRARIEDEDKVNKPDKTENYTFGRENREIDARDMERDARDMERTDRDERLDHSPRARIGDTSEVISHSGLQEEVREIARDMAAAVVSGDMEDYIDFLSDEDRERLENSDSSDEINELSESFSNRWENLYKRSFDSGLSNLDLPVSVKNVTDTAANVVVGGPEESVQLRLVKGGLFNTAWKIDAPESMTLSSLRAKLNSCLSKIESSGTGASESEALRKAALEFLKPVASQV